MSDCFGNDIGQFELITDREQLPTQVEFTSLDIPRCHSNGNAPLCFAFSVEWEQEHGVYIVAHEGEVIGIGNWDDLDDLTGDPKRYSASRNWMTPSESTALERYIVGFEKGDEKT